MQVYAKSKPSLLPLVIILVQKWICNEVATVFNSSYISNWVKETILHLSFWRVESELVIHPGVSQVYISWNSAGTRNE